MAKRRPGLTPGSKIEHTISRRIPRDGDGGGRFEVKSDKIELDSSKTSCTIDCLEFLFLFPLVMVV